jgi:hypothetical protein
MTVTSPYYRKLWEARQVTFVCKARLLYTSGGGSGGVRTSTQPRMVAPALGRGQRGLLTDLSRKGGMHD